MGAKTSRWTVCPRAERRRKACRPRGAQTPRADSLTNLVTTVGVHVRGSFPTSTRHNGRPAAKNCLAALLTAWSGAARASLGGVGPGGLPAPQPPARVDAGRSRARRPPHTRRPASQAPCPAPTQMRGRSGAGGLPGSAEGQVPANPRTREPAHQLRLIRQADFLWKNKDDSDGDCRILSLTRQNAPPAGDFSSGVNAAI